MDYAFLRKRMVAEQLKRRGISDRRVLKAFLTVPREIFAPRDFRDQAYADTAIPIGEGQTISQPYTVAFMGQLLGLKGWEKVLEVGAGSGYAAAILGRLCRQVYALEIRPDLAIQARRNLRKLGIANVDMVVGDGSLGLPNEAPFDAISVAAAADQIPKPLVEQLKIGGRLAMPRGGLLEQQMVKIIKTAAGIRTETHGGFCFVPLIHKE